LRSFCGAAWPSRAGPRHCDQSPSSANAEVIPAKEHKMAKHPMVVAFFVNRELVFGNKELLIMTRSWKKGWDPKAQVLKLRFSG
jgi:hypothetical protein